MKKAVILIPARLASTRFPRKPLAKISGKSMVQRVYENCQKTGLDSFVVTDSKEIEDHVMGFDGKVLRVDDDVPSGSERIYLAHKKFLLDKKYDFIVNVQGDEPLLKAESIKKLVRFHLDSPFEITTLVKPWKNRDERYFNPNVVKVALADLSRQCLYFSRSPIPYVKTDDGSPWYQHIGVYCYRAEALENFFRLPTSHLEKQEMLEQLRALEGGLSIGAMDLDYQLIGVDVPSDIAHVEGVLRE